MNLISSDDENWRHGVFVYILEAVTAYAQTSMSAGEVASSGGAREKSAHDPKQIS